MKRSQLPSNAMTGGVAVGFKQAKAESPCNPYSDSTAGRGSEELGDFRTAYSELCREARGFIPAVSTDEVSLI